MIPIRYKNKMKKITFYKLYDIVFATLSVH